MEKLHSTLLLLILSASGCSLLVDHNSAQCTKDDDCLRFGGHPSCQNGVCVPSGLGPEGCVIGTPTQQTDYLNACSTAQCVPFDNCAPSSTVPTTC